MNKFLVLGAMILALAACDERSTNVGDPTNPDPTDPPITGGSATRVGDLDAASFDDGGTPELTVQLTLDGNQVNQVYQYVETLSNGYALFERQEGTNGRSFLALAATSSDGRITGVVAQDGGQFNRFFGGAMIEQANFSAPAATAPGAVDAGNQRYSGSYAGLVNFGPPAHGGVPGLDGSTAGTPSIVTGDAFVIADFRSGALNGGIYNRVLELGVGIDLIDLIDLIDVILVPGTIFADGTFAGTVENIEQNGFGNYSGAFGGAGATSMGGILNLGGGFLAGTALEVNADGNEKEYGIFVLDRD